MSNDNERQELEQKLLDLHAQVQEAKAHPEHLAQKRHHEVHLLSHNAPHLHAHHSLLLLSDSALPLGSFAFSSGLESYLAHHRPTPPPAFQHFLALSLTSLASTTLPYVLHAHRTPQALAALDNDLDASMPCTVARRASVTQGRALLSVWDRSFRPHVSRADAGVETLLDEFQSSLRAPREFGPNGHLAPLVGVVALLMGLTARQTAYLYLCNHVKGVLSAAVRAGVMGPYQAQGVLASAVVPEAIVIAIDRYWDVAVEDSGQTCPMIDIWMGRHELLYSRIFNS
ncbi:MAG: hypothetical protein M1829_004145 [Trizodia sp. TS-e1964]|nr:MAG: hypothetical protein M1829_004145 [Trizodia sp. TS-e1964]